MRLILPDKSEVPFETFTFPDGQPHIKIEKPPVDSEVLMEISISSPADLFQALMAKEILDRNGNTISAYITYLMGARMDRPIDNSQPYTLKVVCDMIRAAGFAWIGILDPHSTTALKLLEGAEAAYPIGTVHKILGSYNPNRTVIVVPDAGAVTRVKILTQGLVGFETAHCIKQRDNQTGKLSGFHVLEPELVEHKTAFIIDDICDGGGTFVGLAKELREAGAVGVDLFVTHGLFTKGKEALVGIDNIYAEKDWSTQNGEASTSKSKSTANYPA